MREITNNEMLDAAMSKGYNEPMGADAKRSKQSETSDQAEFSKFSESLKDEKRFAFIRSKLAKSDDSFRLGNALTQKEAEDVIQAKLATLRV